ncbi:MAG TPA: monofunctional biosynthetic peptidoglycan transglycosylase [Rhodanobacteraceae bacterium]|nr:monofunctional biosynthetic peptidoglycan transglycosylase [Rhodanobacteraceae bacterium]
MKGRKRPARKRSRTRRLLRLFGYLILAWIGVTWLLVLIMRFVPPVTSAFMMERQLSAWFDGDKNFQLHYHWVPWSRMSKLAPLAMVASEDQNFPFHHGFDFGAIHIAIENAQQGDRLRGASTISQQTAKNLFLWNGRSWVRKGLEAYFTVLLEVTWPKQRILAVYANIAEMGNGIYGVGAASRIYFHTSAAQLGKHQSALLAAVLPNPRVLHANRPSAYVEQRAAWIEQQMRQLGGTDYVTEDDPPRPK